MCGWGNGEESFLNCARDGKDKTVVSIVQKDFLPEK